MKTPIQDCTILFKFLCPKKWENLKPTSDGDIRFCKSCRKNVYLCSTLEEIKTHKGRCIAVRNPDTESIVSVSYSMGDAMGAYVASLPKAERERLRKERLREQGFSDQDE